MMSAAAGEVESCEATYREEKKSRSCVCAAERSGTEAGHSAPISLCMIRGNFWLEIAALGSCISLPGDT